MPMMSVNDWLSGIQRTAGRNIQHLIRPIRYCDCDSVVYADNYSDHLLYTLSIGYSYVAEYRSYEMTMRDDREIGGLLSREED